MGRQTTGIYHKFNVHRVDGSDQPGGKHEGCQYFVLDLTHDKHAPAAMAAYADSCREKYPALADDCKAYADAAGHVSEADTLRAQLAAANEHAEYQDKEIRQWANVCYVGTWPLSEEDTKNTGFYGRMAEKMTAERNTATARAEKAEAQRDALAARVAELEGALECIPVDLINAIENGEKVRIFLSTESCKLIGVALSRTPAQSLAKVQAAAKECRWCNLTAVHFISKETLEAMADRLEAEAANATTNT